MNTILEVLRVNVNGADKGFFTPGDKASIFNTPYATKVTFTVTATIDPITGNQSLLSVRGRFTADNAVYDPLADETYVSLTPSSMLIGPSGVLGDGVYSPGPDDIIRIVDISTYDLGTFLVYPNTLIEDHGLTFVGKGVLNWGEAYSRNFKSLATNFASAISPNNPLEGQLWFDTTFKQLKIWDGTEWDLVYTVEDTSFPYHTFSASATWVVNHGLGLPAPHIATVSCFVDDGGTTKQILPKEITFDTQDQLTVTFTQPRSGYVIVRP